MWSMHEGMGWWWIFGSIWIVVFWGAIIWLMVWSVNRLSGGRRERFDADESPMEIARKRLARGEITKEEFEDLQRTLQ